jgi:hypothetical protein
VIGDWDGDGRADIGVYQQEAGANLAAAIVNSPPGHTAIIEVNDVDIGVLYPLANEPSSIVSANATVEASSSRVVTSLVRNSDLAFSTLRNYFPQRRAMRGLDEIKPKSLIAAEPGVAATDAALLAMLETNDTTFSRNTA